MLLALPATGQQDLQKEELQRLEGEWVQVSVEADGRTVPSEASAPGLKINGDQWIEKSAAGEFSSSFKIDPTKEPKQIDRVITLERKAITLPGIYTLQDDALTVSMPFPFGGNTANLGQRPAQFHTKPGDPFVTTVYKRVAATTAAGEPQELTWQTDWKEAFRIARKEHRLVFVDYRAGDDPVLSDPEVQRYLRDFVLLRSNAAPPRISYTPSIIAEQMAHVHDQEPSGSSQAPRESIVSVVQTYVIYDEYERQLFSFSALSNRPADLNALDFDARVGLLFHRAGEMLDSGNELEADFSLGNTYARLRLLDYAQASYSNARDLAEKSGDKARAQVAEGEMAFLFVYKHGLPRAIKKLQELASKPVDADSAAMIWLMLGNAQRLAKHRKEALDAYEHAKSVAAPDSPAFKAATEAIARAQ